MAADPQMKTRILAVAVVAATSLLAPTLVSHSAAASAFAPALLGKVTLVDDGDTVDVDIAGDHTKKPVRVRYIGVQAMELHVYSQKPSGYRGECWGVEAAKHLYSILHGKHVRLTSVKATSHSNRNVRPRRSVEVQRAGKWVDTGGLQLDAGLALPDLSPDEYRHNRDYMTRAQRAAAAHLGMWGAPAHCGVGPAQDAVLSVHINWDAEHNDAQNVNGEWIDITNNGAAPVSLGGWWIRDASYRGVKAHGYVFPPTAVVQPAGTLRLHVGHGTDTADTFYWGVDEPIFANVTQAPTWMGDGAWLFDPQGDLRFWDMYPCRVGC